MPIAPAPTAPPTPAPGLPAGPDTPTAHLHLWHLPDGTGLHCPPGALAVDPDTGLVCCHLCGRWFAFLGAHVRVHGHTAATYRAEFGLCRGDALAGASLSAAISQRQRRRYERDPKLRQWFAVGQDMARTGQVRTNPPAPAAVARQAAARQAGRETRRARQQAHLDALVDRYDYPDLATLLRSEYDAGASLATLARQTGLGRARLRDTLLAAGVRLRPQGHNTEDGHTTRARSAETLAAQRVGTEDLVGWLQARHASGWTLSRLGEAVGHSGHWVKWRLDAVSTGSMRDSRRKGPGAPVESLPRPAVHPSPVPDRPDRTHRTAH